MTDKFVTLPEIRKHAKKVLPRDAWNFGDGGAESETTRRRNRRAIDRLAIIHRLGRLEIGETSVAILVTSAHRHAAFQACHYAIDRLKQIVPIWKKEYFQDGAVWAEGEGQSSFLAAAFGAQPKTKTVDVQTGGESAKLNADG